MNTTLQGNRIRNIRRTWNIGTVKQYITQNYLTFYDTIQQMSSPLFSEIRPLTHYLAQITNYHNNQQIICIDEEPQHQRPSRQYSEHTLCLEKTSQYLHTWMLIVISSQVYIIQLEGIIDFKLYSSFNYLFCIIPLENKFCL